GAPRGASSTGALQATADSLVFGFVKTRLHVDNCRRAAQIARTRLPTVRDLGHVELVAQSTLHRRAPWSATTGRGDGDTHARAQGLDPIRDRLAPATRVRCSVRLARSCLRAPQHPWTCHLLCSAPRSDLGSGSWMTKNWFRRPVARL